MSYWRKNLHTILRDSDVEAAILSRIRAHDDNPQAWVVLDAFQKYFSTKNPNAVQNFFVFKDGSKLQISQESISWVPSSLATEQQIEDCSYSTWYIAQRIGKIRWLMTFLQPFPDED